MPRYVAKGQPTLSKQAQNTAPPKDNSTQYPQKRQPRQYQQKGNGDRHFEERRRKDKYNWNPKDVTLETVIPEKPKKLLPKPDDSKFKQQVAGIKQAKQALEEEVYRLKQDQNEILNAVRQGKAVSSHMHSALKEKFPLQKQIKQNLSRLRELKNAIYAENDILKADKEKLLPKGYRSVEELKVQIRQIEHRLNTQNINKKEEAALVKEIQERKRNIHKASGIIQAQAQLAVINDQIRLNFKQIDKYKLEIEEKQAQLDKIGEEKKQFIDEETRKGCPQVAQTRTPDQIREQYKQLIDNVQKKKEALKKQLGEIHDENRAARNQFEDQEELLQYIHFIHERQAQIKKAAEEEQKRKKEREEEEEKKRKEFEERERRREERKKREEQRKKKEEERKEEIPREREWFINRHPNSLSIDQCNFLLSYCQSLRPMQRFTKEPPKQIESIQMGKEWEKQINKGAQLIISKKNKVDEAPIPKKPKKEKIAIKEEDQVFRHSFDVVNRFQLLKVLPPSNVTEIEDAKKQIQERRQILQHPSEEEVEEFKIKAAKEFDAKHSSEAEQFKYKGKERKYRGRDKGEEREGWEEEKREPKKASKPSEVNFREEDFPGML